MANSDYIPKDDEGKAALFERVAATLDTYASGLGISGTEVSDQSDDALWFRYILTNARIVRASAEQWTSFKNELLNDPGDGTIPPTPVTTPPATPAPAAVAPGILPRFRELARRIKASAGYTDSIGEALGIVAPEHTPHDTSTLAPPISLRLSGDRVEVLWKKAGMEAIEIQKDTGGGWQFLAVDTRPDYIDTTPFPAAAAKWKYRAIYTQDSQKTGQWSNIAEITVGG